MKKIRALLIVGCTLVLSACLDIGSTTLIKENGSGITVHTVDLSAVMRMMAGKEAKGENFTMDTTIYLHKYADTASFLTARQKELLREMMIRVNIDMRSIQNLKFNVSITNSFNSLADLTEVSELVKQKEYDIIFDKAMRLPFFDKEKQDDNIEKDNFFGSVFPSFFRCNYQKGIIDCTVDSIAYKESQQMLKDMEIDLSRDDEAGIFAAAKFINIISLPSKATKIEGGEWVAGSRGNTIEQKGSLLDLYKNPGKYAYHIEY